MRLANWHIQTKCNSLIILFDTSATVWYLKELQRQNQCVRL